MTYRIALSVLLLGACGNATSATDGAAPGSDGSPLATDTPPVSDTAMATPDSIVDVPPAAPDMAGALAPDVAMPDTGEDAPAVTDAASDATDAAPDATAPVDLAAGLGDGPRPLLKLEQSFLYIFASVGCPSAGRVRVSNAGDGPSAPLKALTVAPLVIGADTCTGHVLGPGEGCDVEVEFTPATAQNLTRPLTISADALSVSLNVEGIVGAPAPPLFVGGTGFGAVRIGKTKTLKTSVGVELRSPEPISISTVSLSGPEFQITKDACTGAMVKPGGSCELEVTFTPAATGERKGTLTVSAPGTCEGEQVVATLVGTGAALPSGPLLIEPAAIDVGVTSTRCWTLTPVHVSNTGMTATAPVAVSVPDQFAVEDDHCSGQSLPAGGGCDLVLRFAPSGAAGMRQGTLTVTAGSATDQVPLSGIAAIHEGVLGTTPSSVNFGSVPFGGSSEKKRVLITSIWGLEVTGITSRVVGDEFRIVEDQCTGTVLRGYSSCALDLVFQPRSYLGRTGKLIVTVPVRNCLPEETPVELTGYSPP